MDRGITTGNKKLIRIAHLWSHLVRWVAVSNGYRIFRDCLSRDAVRLAHRMLRDIKSESPRLLLRICRSRSYPPAFDYDNLVRALHCRLPVRDKHHCHGATKLLESLKDPLLVFAVQIADRFTQRMLHNSFKVMVPWLDRAIFLLIHP